MHVEINYRNFQGSDAIADHVREQLDSAIGRFEERLTRIEVHLADENAAKPGPNDKRCMMEARPRGMQPLVVEEHADDIYDAIHAAAGKLRRALTTRFEKADNA